MTLEGESQAAPGLSGQRTLTVCCRWGLTNRVRVLLSGLALAEATGRQFTMLWPRRSHFGAAYHEVFLNDFNVVERDLPVDTPIYGLYVGGPRWQDFLLSDEKDLTILSGSWVIQPGLFPSHKPLLQRCAVLLDTLQPVPYVSEAVQAFRAQHFRTSMIGVHLRRGDWNHADSRYNTGEALRQVDLFLQQSPQAGILLCTDDGAYDQIAGKETKAEGIKDVFRARYGERVVYTEPRSLDRRTVEAAQDALVDFLLLRATDYVVGTKDSSFSRMAAFGRNVPFVMCASSGRAFKARTLVLWLTGIYPLLKLLGYIEYRQNASYSQLSRHYRRRLRDAWARLRRQPPG